MGVLSSNSPLAAKATGVSVVTYFYSKDTQ